MALLAVAVLVVGVPFVVFYLVTTGRKGSSAGKRRPLPPGPPGWPVVGNLLQVALSGKSFIRYVHDLIDVYGPILTLRMGSRTLIIVSSPELAHEALVKRGQLFASRPSENPTRSVFSCDKFTVNSSVYGPVWRSLRRNLVSGMLSSSRLRDFRPLRLRAMDLYIDKIRSEAAGGGGAVSVLRNARFAVFCILLSMCFGIDLDEDTIVKVDQVMKKVTLASRHLLSISMLEIDLYCCKVLLSLNPRIDDYLPPLRLFFRKHVEEALNVRREQIETIVPLIRRRRREMIGREQKGFSYLDSLLDLRVEGREKSPPTEEELVTLCSEFLNGGTDTTATAIEWAVARLLQYPHVQRRIHGEIVAVVGEGRKVDEKDTEEMTYLQAFVKELLRKHPPTYFSLTHAAVEEAELGGYAVPKDANLEFYLPGISEDPRLWKDAGEFRPERFLEGGEDADMTGATGVRMLPFGAGRRICPGLGMAVTHVSLMLARMVQEFEWGLHSSQPQVDLEEKLEFTVVMRRPLVAAVRPRN